MGLFVVGRLILVLSHIKSEPEEWGLTHCKIVVDVAVIILPVKA